MAHRATPVRAEKSLGDDERARIVGHPDEPAIERIHRARFGQDFSGTGIARANDVIQLGMRGQYENWHVNIRTVVAATDEFDEIETVERVHLQLGNDDIGHAFLHLGERIGGIDAKPRHFDLHRRQERSQDLMHIAIVIDAQFVEFREIIGL